MNSFLIKQNLYFRYFRKICKNRLSPHIILLELNIDDLCIQNQQRGFITLYWPKYCFDFQKSFA